MPKHLHEIRDPIHIFVRLDSDERRVVDSAPFQRLRHIHQLALTHLVYPGATHKRFEHSLGVMELAGRVFDVVTHPYNIHDFPVATKDGRIASSLAMSPTLYRLEAVSVDFVFVDPAILDKAREWLDSNRQDIITPTEGPTDE